MSSLFVCYLIHEHSRNELKLTITLLWISFASSLKFMIFNAIQWIRCSSENLDWEWVEVEDESKQNRDTATQLLACLSTLVGMYLTYFVYRERNELKIIENKDFLCSSKNFREFAIIEMKINSSELFNSSHHCRILHIQHSTYVYTKCRVWVYFQFEIYSTQRAAMSFQVWLRTRDSREWENWERNEQSSIFSL